MANPKKILDALRKLYQEGKQLSLFKEEPAVIGPKVSKTKLVPKKAAPKTPAKDVKPILNTQQYRQEELQFSERTPELTEDEILKQKLDDLYNDPSKDWRDNYDYWWQWFNNQ